MSDKIKVIPCQIKMLPEQHWVAAAKGAISINPANAPATGQLKRAFGEVPPVARLALLTSKYWGSAGVRLTVAFLDGAPQDLQVRIVSHMNAWREYCNVSFVLTDGPAQVRISRGPTGYWSYLGTDILHIAPDQPTMNLQDFSMATPESEFHRVVRHETGHTLGFPHEHMRSEIVDGIDTEKAITYFGQTQGWSRQEVINQVLTPLSDDELQGSAHADPNSVMCYWLPAEIMKDNVAIPGGTDIDKTDQDFAASVYPT